MADPRAEPARPAHIGFRWPAEWEPHRATWLAWPHNPETWPGLLVQAERAFLEMAVALSDGEDLEIVVRDPGEAKRVEGLLAAAGSRGGSHRFHLWETDDSWVRDTGPVFLTGPEGLAGADFRFDAWGGKYPPWDRDDGLAARILAAAGAASYRAEFVLEGGSIDGDGRGCLLTTESCLLHSRPEAGRDKALMERRLRAWLGAREVIWLSGEVQGDDTDGHVDDLARFLRPGVVVAPLEEDSADPNFRPLAENRRRLGEARDAAGRKLEVVDLPMPPPVFHRGERCPASYANFYLANGRVLVPVFGAPTDERALAGGVSGVASRATGDSDPESGARRRTRIHPLPHPSGARHVEARLRFPAPRPPSGRASFRFHARSGSGTPEADNVPRSRRIRAQRRVWPSAPHAAVLVQVAASPPPIRGAASSDPPGGSAGRRGEPPGRSGDE